MKIRTLGMVVVGMVLVCLAAGCAAPTPTTVPPTPTTAPAPTETPTPEAAQPVVITLVSHHPAWEEELAKTADLFKEKYPHISVEVSLVETGQIETVISTGIAGGEPADIYDYWPYEVFRWQEAAYDLTDELDADGGEWRSQFSPELLSVGTIDGRVYDVPMDSMVIAIFYNKPLFEELGLGEAGPWAEFVELMDAIKASGRMEPITTFGQQIFIPCFTRILANEIALHHGVLDDFSSGKLALTTENILRDALTETKKVWDAGYFYGGLAALTLSRDEAHKAFCDEEAAMLMETTRTYAAVDELCDFEMGAFVWPAWEEGEYADLGSSNGWFIPNTAPHRDEAVLFLKFLTSPEIQQLWYEDGLIIPSNPSITIDKPIFLEMAKWGEYAVPRDVYTISGEIRAVFGALHDQVMLGEVSIDDAVQQLETLRLETAE